MRGYLLCTSALILPCSCSAPSQLCSHTHPRPSSSSLSLGHTVIVFLCNIFLSPQLLISPCPCEKLPEYLLPSYRSGELEVILCEYWFRAKACPLCLQAFLAIIKTNPHIINLSNCQLKKKKRNNLTL